MSAPRAVLSALALVVLVAALAGGALWWLGDGGATPPEPGDGNGQETVETGRGDAPVAGRFDERERAQLRHDLPWPFAEFEADIVELRRPALREVRMLRLRAEEELDRQLSGQTLTIHLENATVEDIVAEITRHFEPKGVRVFTQDPPVPNNVTFERFHVTDVTVWQIIDMMRERTRDLVQYAVTPEGLCIGSKKACFNARVAGNRWEERQVGEGATDEEFAFLDGKTYRPDFVDAHVAAVIRDVREQSGVEVVVDAEIWNNAVKLSWRSDPMPVLAALRQIAIKCGGALYAKDGRVFLLDR
jgi:hypothetical protein